jgi:hypothetical protein
MVVESTERMAAAYSAMSAALEPAIEKLAAVLAELEKAGVLSPDRRTSGGSSLPDRQTLPDGTPLNQVKWIRHRPDGSIEYETVVGRRAVSRHTPSKTQPS